VLPSYHEGTPRSTLEAMAIGRAVITTDVPGCRETVRHGENGLLVPAYDADALADAMRTLILAPERVPAMGLASRRLVEERFDVHKVNRKILDTLGIAWPEDDLLSRRAS
jgi:glycosyltransferase involved in cell wall biosynthesis